MTDNVSVPRDLFTVIRDQARGAADLCDHLLAEPVPPAPRGILTSAEELAQLKMEGPAWNRILKEAATKWAPVIDANSRSDTGTLANAIVWARLRFGDSTSEYYMDCVEALDELPHLPRDYNALDLARSAAYIFAMDLLGYRSKAILDWLADIRHVVFDVGGGKHSIITAAETKGNNWGASCGVFRIAVARLLEDDADLKECADIFYGFLGDRSRWSGFKFDDEVLDLDKTWAIIGAPIVPINPKGTFRFDFNVDGIIPDDMRRNGPLVWRNGKVIPPVRRTDYTWEVLQGLVLQAELLLRAGYGDVYEASDRAILRAFNANLRLGWLPLNDDQFIPWVIKRRYGAEAVAGLTLVEGCPPGKAIIGLDWVLGGA